MLTGSIRDIQTQEPRNTLWFMCYTSSQHVDLANEYSYDFRNAYGALSVSICPFVPLKQVNWSKSLHCSVDAYRTNCRNYPFSEVVYVRHLDDSEPSSPVDTASYTMFQTVGRAGITASSGTWFSGRAPEIYVVSHSVLIQLVHVHCTVLIERTQRIFR